MKMKLLVST